MATYVLKVARSAGLIALFLIAALLGIATGVIFAYVGDVPQISALDDYAPSTITRVYGSKGEVIGEFAIQRREVIPYDAISPKLRQAIIAAEDSEFERHFGLSMPHIIMAATRDVLGAIRDRITGQRSRPKGASTITQQLARGLFPEAVGYQIGDVSLERKIKEAIVAVQIEKRYTKREIFTFYANQMYLGEGAYGVEAAARAYFGKSAKDLSLDESAMIAGLFQTWRNAPTVNMERAKRRRGYVLQRMADDQYITQKEASEANARPIVVAAPATAANSLAPYFVEEVRKDLESRYGAKKLYENGLSVQTGLDVKLQEAANRALDDGLRRIDRRRGFRKPRRNVIAEKKPIDAFKDPRWDRPMAAGDVVPALVTSVEGPAIQLRAGPWRVTIDKKGFAWTGKTSPAQLVHPGDLVETRLVTADAATNAATGTLEQPPLVEGAMLAIDNRTGQIRALIGGYSFDRSKFDRAMQAYRQVGSAFKPIVYTAAIDRGYTPSSIIMDTPASFPGAAGSPVYAPMNYDKKFEGPVTLRHALEESRNVPAVRVMEQLGPAHVIQYARRLGLQSPIPPFLAVALGAAEATLYEMTSAYSVFPNQGVRMRPYAISKVSDREGNVLEENRPEPKEAIRADTAFVMTNLLRGVVQRGTAAKAAALNWPLGGKTGTTDDYTDAWFVGFDPDITVGVWVGLDQKKPIGSNMTGAEAALPIWIDIMKAWIGDRKEPPQFPSPGNIVFVTVDKGSGEPATDGTPGAIPEAFIAGTQPGSIR
ncbi:MAG TPA: PBP1A family penicillin-binding protein [Vicinamibacterales bacterium]|nr:PBP1A family penicillin-binding protein [Vicinamibacterales bacterium]